MSFCRKCGWPEPQHREVKEVFGCGERFVMVERVPASVCKVCGDVTISDEVMDRVRELVRGAASPPREVLIEAFTFVWDGVQVLGEDGTERNRTGGP